MPRSRDSSVFTLTLLAAAAVLVSIAGAETLLAIAFLAWIVHRPRKVVWPSYFVPLCAFMATTTVALLMSPQPEVGMAVVRKFVLFTIGLLAANLITTPARARMSLIVLLSVAATASVFALIQFGIAYRHFLSTQSLADDPTVLARITGFMGHWMTFSGEQLLVWCAALPAALMIGRRLMIPLGIVGAALVLSFTRSAWLGAFAGFVVVTVLVWSKVGSRVLLAMALPIVIVAAAASGLIYHRLSFSFRQQGFGPDSARVELLVAGAGMIKDHPLFGVGPERIHTEFPRYYRGNDLTSANFFYGHLENNIVQLAAERGLFCLAAFLWFIFALYRSLIGMLQTATDETRWVIVSALSALTGFIVAGLFTYNFGDSEVLLLLLFIVSVPYGVLRSVPIEDSCPSNLVTTTS